LSNEKSSFLEKRFGAREKGLVKTKERRKGKRGGLLAVACHLDVEGKWQVGWTDV
jgi:hypothetical protein